MSWRKSAGLPLLLLLLCTSPAVAQQQQKLELRGTVTPRIAQSIVAISSNDSPFRKQGHVFYGKFKFSGLTPGTYTVTVYHPQWGPTRKTIAVTPSFADKKGRVEITFELEQSPEGRERNLENRNTVTIRELSIAPQAEREFEAGRKELAKRNTDKAIAHLKQAVEISPQFVAAWNELGTIAYQTARYEDAEGYFREALKHDPEAFSPMVNLGGTLLSLQHFEDALPYNLQAVELNDEDALANSQTGMNYFYLGKMPEALQYLRKAKELDPAHFSQPQIFLAEIYGYMGQPKQATEELQDFLKRHPDSPRAPQVRQAIDRLEKAMKEDGLVR